LSFERAVPRSLEESWNVGLVFDVVRGPTIRGAVGGERSAFEADAAVPQARRVTPQTAAYWTAAFTNARHPTNLRGRLQAALVQALRRNWTERLKQPRQTFGNPGRAKNPQIAKFSKPRRSDGAD
jgi:hypothetical protein